MHVTFQQFLHILWFSPFSGNISVVSPKGQSAFFAETASLHYYLQLFSNTLQLFVIASIATSIAAVHT